MLLPLLAVRLGLERPLLALLLRARLLISARHRSVKPL
jgi:hypothetical protein